MSPHSSDSILREIAQAISTASGDEFFRSLVTALCQTLEVDFAFIGRVDADDPNRIHIMGVCIRGEIAENFSYHLHGTPCENVVGREPCHYPRDIRRLFPEDHMLVEMGIESYIGHPLFGSDRQPLGLLAVMHSQAMPDEEPTKSVLRICGARAAAELERRRSDQALRESEEHYHVLARLAPVGIFRTDTEGHCIYVNQQWCDIAGISPEQACGDGWAQAIHPDDRQYIFERWYATAKNDLPFKEECRLQRPDGYTTWVLAQATAERGANGQVTSYVGTITDITERKQAEAEMLKLSSVVEQTADSVLITDRDGVIQYVNPAYEAITGYTREDAVGKKPNIVKSGNHDEAFYERLWSTIRRGEVFRERFINRKKDGSLYYEEKTITPLKNEKGDITHFVSTGKDITARMLAENENQRTQAFLHSVVENLPNMLFVKDAKDLRFVRFNRAAEELLGYSRDEMLGKNDYDFFPKEEADFFTAKDRDVLDSGQPHDVPEEPIHTRHKGVRLLHTQKIPILDESGKPLYLLGISEDITERKTAEDMLARLGRILDSSSNEIYVFCADSLRFIQVNQGAQRNLGYNMEELRSLTPLDLKPGFTKQDFEALIAPLRRGEQDTAMLETVHKRKDGSLYQVEVRLQLFRNETPPVFVAIVQDITERMRAMEALRASERRYQTMTEISPVGIFHTDVDGNCLYVNERWSAIAGLSIEQARGTAWANALHPEDRERVFAEWNRAVNDHALFYAEYRFKRSDGVVTWVLGQARAETDGAGKIIGYVGTITDITERKRAEKALAQSAAEWTYSMDFIEDAMYLIDTDDKIVRANRAFYQLTGLSPDQTIGHDITSIMHPQGEPTPCRVCQARHARRDCHIIMEPQDPDNPTGHPIEVTMRIIRDAAGTPTGVLMDIRDLTPMRETERVLRESEADLANAQRIAHVGNWNWDLVTNELRWSDEVYHIFGLKPQQSHITAETFLNAVHPDDRTSVTETADKAITEKLPFDLDFRIVRPNGVERIVHEQAEVTFDENGKPIRMVGTIQDITNSRRTQERLNYLAYYDTLTGLPNRVLLQDRLHQAMLEADRRDRLVAVMFLDLDRFKIINDTLGHDVGDALLKEVAGRLTACVRAGDTISRLGGDEFTVILANVAHVDDVSRVAQKIIDSFIPPFQIAGREMFMSTSIGITLCPLDDSSLENLMRNADAAMYHAKEMGRNTFQFYTAELNRRTAKRLQLETALRHALERHELLLHYQPQVNIKTGKIIGMEALLRWQHPEMGLIPPLDFIPLAEETGLIIPIGEWVLRTACHQAQTWRQAGIRGFQVAVNLSGRQFQHRNLAKLVKNVLKETGLDPRHLDLELTESILMHNIETTLATMNELHVLGVAFSMDDFGTGYSSLSYLKRFPIDTLKIDRSFVRDITSDPDDAAISQAIIAMSHGLGAKVIAEGVETAKQLAFLRAHRCDAMQGYYFSKPVSAEDMNQLLLKDSRLAVRKPSKPGKRAKKRTVK